MLIYIRKNEGEVEISHEKAQMYKKQLIDSLPNLANCVLIFNHQVI